MTTVGGDAVELQHAAGPDELLEHAGFGILNVERIYARIGYRPVADIDLRALRSP